MNGGPSFFPVLGPLSLGTPDQVQSGAQRLGAKRVRFHRVLGQDFVDMLALRATARRANVSFGVRIGRYAWYRGPRSTHGDLTLAIPRV